MCGCTHNLFNQFLVDEHLGCCQIFSITTMLQVISLYLIHFAFVCQQQKFLEMELLGQWDVYLKLWQTLSHSPPEEFYKFIAHWQHIKVLILCRIANIVYYQTFGIFVSLLGERQHLQLHLVLICSFITTSEAEQVFFFPLFKNHVYFSSVSALFLSL